MSRWPLDHRRMSSEQFAAALEELGLSDDDFARDYGTRSERVGRWRRGEDNVPIHMDILLGLWAMPGGREIVQRIRERNLIKPPV